LKKARTVDGEWYVREYPHHTRLAELFMNRVMVGRINTVKTAGKYSLKRFTSHARVNGMWIKIGTFYNLEVAMAETEKKLS
jgi:hypothetical protein